MPIIYDPKYPGGFIEAEDILATSDINVYPRRNSFFNVPPMTNGNIARDNGHLILTPAECDELIAREPRAEKWIRPFVGGGDFVKGKQRYCLWLVGCSLAELRKMPLVRERVKAVRKFRLKSANPLTYKKANKPMLFSEMRQPTVEYLLIPQFISERRQYIPMEFFPPEVITNSQSLIIPDAGLFHFGVLSSSVHMTWAKMACKQFKNQCTYALTVCYNPFPWPLFHTESQWQKIEQTAQNILDVRAKYSNVTMNDLYDESLMPYDLREAHKENDLEVLKAYYFPPDISELEMQIRLLHLYQTLHEEYDDLDEE